MEDDNFILTGPSPKEPLPKASLGRLFYQYLLTTTQDDIAMIDGFTDQKLSYKEWFQQSANLAQALRLSGYDSSTHMAICSENNLQFFVPILSSLFIGSTMAPLNPSYTTTELLHVLSISKPKIIFCSQLVLAKFLALEDDLGYVERIIVIDSNSVKNVETIDSFIKENLEGEVDLEGFQVQDGEPSMMPAFILCSSGTTGLPKGVVLSQTNITVTLMHSCDPRYALFGKPGESIIGILPFFHSYGLITNLSVLYRRRTVIALKTFEEDLFLQAIEKYKITILMLAPPLVVFLAKSPKVLKYNLSSVREIISGAAPLSKETEEEVLNRLKLKSIKQGYGLTEATLAVLLLEADDIKRGSSGKVISYMSVKLREPESGKSLGPNQVGEVCVKGPMLMMKYEGNPEATSESFTEDGWLKTGDLAYYDQDGYFYIVDRLKELIKYKGFQVAPAELEAVLLSHGKVRDCGVVGLPHEVAGELPMAFVVKHQGVELNEQELVEFVQGKVSSSKWLRGGVVFVNEIPKNPTGKILRRELKQLLKNFKAKL